MALLALGLAACDRGPSGGEVFGPCRFDRAALSFAGDSLTQARCLLRPVQPWAKLGAPLKELPDVLETIIEQRLPIGVAAFRAYLIREGLSEADVGGLLAKHLSRARDDAEGAPTARYFVLHDTSTPYLGEDRFPDDLEGDPGINRLDRSRNDAASAHVFVNRQGEVYLGHDFRVPWRATKLERNDAAGVATQGLFLHVELVQPRRRHPAGGSRNDALAPEPGFSKAQYRRAAELYVAASLRAGRGLIPAFHAVLDSGFRDGHDDPQNFDLAAWAAEIEAVLRLAGA